MSVDIANRKRMLDALRRELLGPSAQGEERDCSLPIEFDDPKDSYGPWKQLGSGEEILQRDSPTQRYGIGVLYPWQTVAQDRPEDAGEAAIGSHGGVEQVDASSDASALAPEAAKDLRSIEEGLERRGQYDEGLADLDLAATSTYRPSSMGVSFFCELPSGSTVVLEASLGRYQPVEVKVRERTLIWWLRIPMTIRRSFSAETILAHDFVRLQDISKPQEDCEPIDLRAELFARPNPYNDNPQARLITLCLVNRTELGNRRLDELCLFQCSFVVRVISPEGGHRILPYPETPVDLLEKEEKSLFLLYRSAQTYAVGHGCAANWGTKDQSDKVDLVKAEALPVYETASTTADIEDGFGEPIKVAMAPLAGLVPGNNGFDELERVVRLYEEWITAKQNEISGLPAYLQQTAKVHLENCIRCANRMRQGLEHLQEDGDALKAFQLANRAILLQQLAGKELRVASYDRERKRWSFSNPFIAPEERDLKTKQPQWRAFQIAFLLMSLRSTAEKGDADREIVELIWFPTGGGKTEAYLGLAAYAMFMRRLKNPTDDGVSVVTRYTLRLLTAQQFQRTSRLICAMERIREQNPELGSKPFTIGIWVGGGNTPNTRQEAIQVLNGLKKSPKYTENKFVLGQCPWCGAQMGTIRENTGKKWSTEVAGYLRQANTVVLRCPDGECPFNKNLPVLVIDEDIYERRPSIIIGTVDKFAALAWRPEARALFGIGKDGSRSQPPPDLIIQDELHLISGPLGSMVGLYETVIEELCTDRRHDYAIRPKIICSTATTRRYSEQIKALYGRSDVTLFPPPGLDADDSFFARYARDTSGKLLPGRMYVGVHAPGLGSLQTVQVRTFASLLQTPVSLNDPKQQDAWWTLLIFFNSLRELGTSLSLFQSDIPDYLKVTANRQGIKYGSMRKLRRIRELTGRLRSDEVPEAIAALEVSTDNSSKILPVDACLASNILEVGVDIDRLSLMAVVGQPKSTSQYIQVTGRVGRRWWERPGLVVTILTASKPRDKSHFEKFRSYHERLYAQVEPSSVTPFSPSALDRALHAIMVVYARQLGAEATASRPYPYPEDLMKDLRSMLLPRVMAVDEAEAQNFIKVFDRRATEWKRWKRTEWQKRSPEDSFLLRRAGEYASSEDKLISWETPSSMRNVDAECEARITTLYLQD